MSLNNQKQKKPLQHTRTFYCDQCDPKNGMSGQVLKNHMEEKHGLKELKGTKRLECCMDGKGFYSNTWTWIFPGNIHITEISEGPKG